MTEFKDKLIQISLILMIILSLYLSWKIWTKPSNHSFLDNSDNNKKITEVVQKKDMTDVYLPTKLFFHRSNNQLLYTNREATIGDIQKKVTGFEFSNGREMSEEEIAHVMKEDEVVNMMYPTEFPISLFLDLYHLDARVPGKQTSMPFSQLMVSLKKEHVYFINQDRTQGVEMAIRGDFNSLKRLLESDKNNYFDVSLEDDNVGGIYYLTGKIELKIYSYIVSTQSYTTFSKAYFNQPDDLFSNEGENLNLSNSEGESLTIDSKTGEVNYYGKLQQKETYESNALYFNTFQYVENMGNALGNVRFFDSKADDVTYRNYVEGFPVFGDNMKGRLEATIQNKNVFIRTNQETLQIPIPSDETVTLIPTSELIEQLVNAGVKVDDITDIQIGYKWQTNVETKQAVDLVPEWYINYQENWYSQKELLSHLHQGGTN